MSVICFTKCVCLQSRVPSGSSEPKLRVYDAEHERRRKDQLNKLFHRTTEQVHHCFKDDKIITLQFTHSKCHWLNQNL